MQMLLILTYGQCFFLGKCLIGPLQVNCFGMGYSGRKKQTGGGRGGLRTYFFLKKNPWNCFGFSLYPWKFQVKQNSTPGNLVKLCMLHSSEISRPKETLKKPHPWKFGNISMLHPSEKVKTQDHWKFHMNFSWSPLGIFRVVFN